MRVEAGGLSIEAVKVVERRPADARVAVERSEQPVLHVVGFRYDSPARVQFGAAHDDADVHISAPFLDPIAATRVAATGCGQCHHSVAATDVIVDPALATFPLAEGPNWRLGRFHRVQALPAVRDLRAQPDRHRV